MRSPLLLALALAALPAGAQAPDAAFAETAAEDVVPYLEAPAILAATAALLHADAGRFPAAPFDLLGAPVAAETGARRVRLARLDLDAGPDTLRVAYVLVPNPEVPHERTGTFALFREGDRYTARILVDLRADPDLRDADLPLTTAGTLRVRRGLGRLGLDPAYVRELAISGRLPAEAPFLTGEPIAFAFVTARGDRTFATVTLTPDYAAP
jgi:hypothetical protein